MLSDPLFLVVAAAMILVVVILLLGIGSFGKGGEFHRKNANRLMRYRVGAQFVAILLILVFVLVRRGGGS